LDKSPRFELCSREKCKRIGRLIFRKIRGPQSLIQSLLLGLDDLRYEYIYNPKYDQIRKDDVVYVTGSMSALKFALELKREGKIKKLIAGPTLVVTPDEHGGIIKDKNIDIYLVPSAWTKDFYASFGDEELNRKLQICPTGVSLPDKLSKKRDSFCLIYNKISDTEILENVTQYLKKVNIPVQMLTYGKYKKKNYFSSLKKASFMIYFSEIESQGIALLEAWAHDIPTLVWNNDRYTFAKIHKTVSGPISAPYLTDACGVFFKKNDIKEKFEYVIGNLNTFHPRLFVEHNFTNKICAQNFLDIITK